MTSNEMKFNFQLKFDSLFEFSAPAYDDRQISYLLTEAQFRVFIKRYNPLGNKYQEGFEMTEQRRRDLEQLIKSGSIDAAGVTGAITYSGNTDGSTAVVSNLDTIVGLNEGLAISGTGLTTNSIIKKILSPTSIELDKATTAAGTSVSLTSGLGKAPSQGQIHPNGVFLDLPEGFLLAIEEAATLLGNEKEAWIKPVRHDEYLANINNPFKKPYKDLVWRMDISRETHAAGTSVYATPKRTEIITDGVTSLSHYRIRYLATPPSIICDEFDDSMQVHCILDETLHREIIDEAVVIAQAAAQKESYQIGLSEQQRAE